MSNRGQMSSNPAVLAAAAASSPSSSGSVGNNNSVVGLHYKIGKKIGEGSFGVIFEGTNIINGVAVAIKFEPRKTEAPQLRDEYRTYKHLQGCPGIPNAYYFGQEGLHNILVIDLLGPSLEDLFDWCGRRFSIKTVVQVAIQMLTLIEDVHRHDLIYRDIKPDNFLIGRQGLPDENQVHLVDFGMAKQYRDPRTKQHIPYREKKSLSGTARYMSINTHLGREQSRRDDLEALGHVFFYFLKGQLPWQGLKAPTNKQKYEKIGDKKRTTPAVTLCDGLPRQFAEYLDSVRSLPFDAEPAYEEYRMLLISALDDLGQSSDGDYDWLHLNGGKGWDAAINKKPNLHGYGHPNPPNERERRHREHRRSRQHHSNYLQQQQLSSSQNQPPQQSQSQLSAAQLHQQKLQHLVNRPLPPIKQESQNNDLLANQSTTRNQPQSKNYENITSNKNPYEQQQAVDENDEKGFWSKLCCR
ncbi:Piso0_001408 [Millerozyma farinosa CBS 7064]|uniref:non-specific serine/threonine protein kinase n=1 Tax=Pichia sorbitophila (strain ATCC MYA-4447 / BCRC 22081 / CBS 7064 / NBRC 10061 / NRRL Y-12695) TaxID=559304 RepID=G8YKQ2_PICSO|nr:Piso0_001408 [Millerozyma farinosa CBS 7064]